MSLIDEYEINLVCSPCEPGSERWSAFAMLAGDISKALPYLNAIWTDAIYDHDAKILTKQSGGRTVAVRPEEVAVSGVVDRDDAERQAQELIAEINSIWERRDDISPSTEKRRRATAMELYRLLPRTNCKACGQATTCWTFSLQLSAGSVDLSACVSLQEPTHAQQREQLHRLLALAS